MQFHLNGFRPGDPNISEADPRHHGRGERPADVDVLIVGCGPAGLTLAAQLAAFPEMTVRIVEQKPGPIQLGQADGIACRTMEMFEAFGFAHRLMREASWINEITFWKPDDAESGRIVRSHRVQDVEDGLSEFPHVVLNQARVHDYYLEQMRNAPTRLAPEYSRRVIDLAVPADPAARVTVRLERLDDGNSVETIRARYVVGCDGARSTVRRCLGLAPQGDAANHAWGVMDVLAVTDFPDVRLKAVIQSGHEGSALIIPREGGYLFRIYIELGKLAADQRVATLDLTADRLVETARRILHPFTLVVKEIAWWSVYEIGQRLCARFDDAATPEMAPRVFIAGDACHTHSPKAGQGMNVSMQDAFNLGWKLAAVQRGQAQPALLRTYSAERHQVARDLIDFDRKLAAMFSAKAREEADTAGLQRYLAQQLRYTAGVETQYRPALLTGTATWQPLATGFVIGRRFHSAPVIRVADARPLHLGHVARADGRWRVYAFAPAGDAGAPGGAIETLCGFLAAPPLGRLTSADADIDAVVEVLAVFQHGHRDLDVVAMPAQLVPTKGRYGLRDLEKVFCADPRPDHDIFALRGIDRAHGCMVVVRPDQYVAHVLPLNGHDALAAFFAGLMRSAEHAV